MAAVASALHLRPEVVEALEGGDESALPALTFVRGYIKAYARLLGLDEREVLAALPTDDSYRARPLKAVGMRRKRTLRLPSGKWFFWLLLVASVFALITYGVPLIERMMDNVKVPEEDGSSLVITTGCTGTGCRCHAATGVFGGHRKRVNFRKVNLRKMPLKRNRASSLCRNPFLPGPV